jgi:MOSC domain-containing protein YiiM
MIVSSQRLINEAQIAMSSARVFQINVSNGGVPKSPVSEGQVTRQGLAGDRQRDGQHHGGSQRALCLFPLEAILELQRQGHPIYPGAIGENVTIAGLDWRQVVPGVQLQLGAEVCVQITDYAHPCSNIAAAFADGNINVVSAKKTPRRARVYARVLQDGLIRPGDTVTLLR